MKRAAWIVVFLVGCGGTSEPMSTGTVDANGGTLAVGAMTVDIPAGALPGRTAFTLSSIGADGVVAGLSYRLAGDVGSFAVPARVTFSLPVHEGLPVSELYPARLETDHWAAMSDADHHAAEHEGPHGETHPAHHGGTESISAPHDHLSGSVHGPGHFGVIHCPHGSCP